MLYNDFKLEGKSICVTASHNNERCDITFPISSIHSITRFSSKTEIIYGCPEHTVLLSWYMPNEMLNDIMNVGYLLDMPNTSHPVVDTDDITADV